MNLAVRVFTVIIFLFFDKFIEACMRTGAGGGGTVPIRKFLSRVIASNSEDSE